MKKHLQNKMGKSLAREIDTILGSLGTSDWSDLTNRLKALEAHFTNIDPELSIEVRRRVAEALFMAAVSTRQPKSKCRLFFKNLSILGFTNLALEVDYSILYATMMDENGARKTGLQFLENLKKRLLRDSTLIANAITKIQSKANELHDPAGN